MFLKENSEEISLKIRKCNLTLFSVHNLKKSAKYKHFFSVYQTWVSEFASLIYHIGAIVFILGAAQLVCYGEKTFFFNNQF